MPPLFTHGIIAHAIIYVNKSKGEGGYGAGANLL